MRSVRQVALAGVLVLSAGVVVGCRNRVADENKAMWNQNRELQSELDRKNAELEAARRDREARNAAPPPAPAPAPTAVAPAPPPAPVAPPKAPITDIGGAEATENKAAGTITVNLPSDLYFDSGAATIRSPARASLDKVAAALKKDYAGKPVRVEGHTDSDPIKKSKWKSNQALSEARAKTVRDYLVSKGVDSSNMTMMGYGDQKPRGTDKARNRRVEIVVLVDANAANAHQPAAMTPAPSHKVDKPELNK